MMMENKQSTLVIYLAIFFSCINIVMVFFNWIEFFAEADVNVLGISSSYRTEIGGPMKGIQLPGGYAGLFFMLLFIILILKRNKLIIYFGIAAIINGIGYAAGWFVRKSEFLSIDIIKEYATAKVIVEPQTALWFYIGTAVCASLMTFFIRNKL
jgi:hypothetical protein